jgi:hypothetical protein
VVVPVTIQSDEALPFHFFALTISGDNDGAPQTYEDLSSLVFRIVDSDPTAAPELPATPVSRSFSLHSVVPNPTSGATTLRFRISGPGLLAAEVYDAAGRLVRTLRQRRVDTGETLVGWDGLTDQGPRAAAGVYYVRSRLERPDGTGQRLGAHIVVLR